ncbi:MAG TPA: lysophospholipid acyltransferase family protein, partial [Myxococcota bacterium]|nr:lysophospholipid acyltransferase family protein [Myxococcota bacterium]
AGLFAAFGIGALALVVLVLPLARLARFGAPRDLVAQRWIQRAFRLFTWLGEALHVWGVEVRGAEKLGGGPALVVANHPSLVDVVFLIARLPQADCVVKADAFRNPFLRGIVRLAGYIPNRDGAELVAECARRLRAGRTLVLFPEGSRSPAAGLRPFKRGAAHIALASGAPLRPVWIECRPRILGKNQPWWAIPGERVRYTLRVGADVSARELAAGRSDALAARHVTEALQRLIENGAVG